MSDAVDSIRSFLYVLAIGTRSISVMSLKGAGDAVPLQNFSFENKIQSNIITGMFLFVQSMSSILNPMDLDFENVQGLAVYVRP